MQSFVFVLAFGALVCHCASAINLKDVTCETLKYPPPNNTIVDKFVINLDLAPEHRWDDLVNAKKTEIMNLRTALVNLTGSILDGKILKLIDQLMPELLDTLPSPFKEEMQGLSSVSGMPLGEVVLYNLFYEFFTVCTSIVAEDANGEIFHARNLDFGLFLGWDLQKHSWAMTEVLRPTVVQLDFQKGGKTVYKAVNFAGYLGILTGMKPNKFTLTIDERFQLNGGFIGILEWLMGDKTQQWAGFLTRQLMESDTDFDGAKKSLTAAKTLAPIYFILGGVNKGEGVILTKDRNTESADVYSMLNATEPWFVLQTNYDHWQAPPFFDDRRNPGIHCMQQMTQKNTGFQGLFNVLSSQPVLNKLTAYAALMHAKSGDMETYLQECKPIDCTPW